MNQFHPTAYRVAVTIAVLAFMGASGTIAVIATRAASGTGLDLAATVAFTISVLSLSVSAATFYLQLRPRQRRRPWSTKL